MSAPASAATTGVPQARPSLEQFLETLLVTVATGVTDQQSIGLETVALAKPRRVDGPKPLGVDAVRNDSNGRRDVDALADVLAGRWRRDEHEVGAVVEPAFVRGGSPSHEISEPFFERDVRRVRGDQRLVGRDQRKRRLPCISQGGEPDRKRCVGVNDVGVGEGLRNVRLAESKPVVERKLDAWRTLETGCSPSSGS